MWIFTSDKAINTDQVEDIWLPEKGKQYICPDVKTGTIVFDYASKGHTTIDCGSYDRANYIYKDIMSELGKGTLIFNVDRRLGK